MRLQVHILTLKHITEFAIPAFNTALKLDGRTVRRKQFPLSVSELKQLFPLSAHI